MKIREIIDEHYKDFLYVCTNKAINGEDEFDVLDNCCITAIRKFDEKDIDEQEGLDYLWRISSYRDWETDRKSTRLNSSHSAKSRMPSSA